MSNELTSADFKSLHQDLSRLKAENDEIVQKMADMQTRDLASSTSDAFFQLKSEQGDISQRIDFIRDRLKDATIVNGTEDLDKIGVGNRVRTYNLEAESVVIFEIVGTASVKPNMNRVTAESPLGQALIGKERGQEVEVETPDGIDKYRVLEITAIPDLM